MAEISSHPSVPNPFLMALSSVTRWPHWQVGCALPLAWRAHSADFYHWDLIVFAFKKKLRYKPHAIKPLLLDTQFSDALLIHKLSQPLPKRGTFASTPRETPSTNVPVLCPQLRQPPNPFLLLLICFANSQCFITQMMSNNLGPIGLGVSHLGQWLQASFSVKLLWVFCLFYDWLLLCMSTAWELFAFGACIDGAVLDVWAWMPVWTCFLDTLGVCLGMGHVVTMHDSSRTCQAICQAAASLGIPVGSA